MARRARSFFEGLASGFAEQVPKSVKRQSKLREERRKEEKELRTLSSQQQLLRAFQPQPGFEIKGRNVGPKGITSVRTGRIKDEDLTEGSNLISEEEALRKERNRRTERAKAFGGPDAEPRTILQDVEEALGNIDIPTRDVASSIRGDIPGTAFQFPAGLTRGEPVVGDQQLIDLGIAEVVSKLRQERPALTVQEIQTLLENRVLDSTAPQQEEVTREETGKARRRARPTRTLTPNQQAAISERIQEDLAAGEEVETIIDELEEDGIDTELFADELRS